MKAGEPVPMDDPEYPKIGEEVNRTLSLTSKLNESTEVNEVRQYLEKIIGEKVAVLKVLNHDNTISKTIAFNGGNVPVEEVVSEI